MKNKVIAIFAMLFAFDNATASNLVYLTCSYSDVSYEFTLDEANGTVTYYWPEVTKELIVDKAKFDSEKIMWTYTSELRGSLELPLETNITVTRTISRIDLTFIEEYDLTYTDKSDHEEGKTEKGKTGEGKTEEGKTKFSGTCKKKTSKNRKF